MSFRDLQKTAVKITESMSYWVSFNKPKYGGLENGSHYFVLGFGDAAGMTKNGEFLSADRLMDEALVWHKAQMYVQEMGESGQYVQWHFTGPNDPIIELGYGAILGNGALRTTDEKSRNEAKLTKLYNGKGNYTKYLYSQVHLPVMMLNKDLDIAAGKVGILIVSRPQALNMFGLAENFKMSKNKGLLGRIAQLTKDTTKGIQAYTWKLLETDNALTPELSEQFAAAASQEERVLTSYYENVNNGADGDTPSEKVWNYLTTVSGLTRAQFFAKYNVVLNDGVEMVETHQINFSDDEE